MKKHNTFCANLLQYTLNVVTIAAGVSIAMCVVIPHVRIAPVQVTKP